MVFSKVGEEFRVAHDVIHRRPQFVIHAVRVGSLLGEVFIVKVIFNKAQKRAPTSMDSLKVVAEFRGQAGVLHEQFRIADDVIHRCPQIVADA